MSKTILEKSILFYLGDERMKKCFICVCKKFSLSDEISINIYSCCWSLFGTKSYYERGVIEFILALYLIGGKEHVIDGEKHEVFFIKFLKRYSFCFDFDQGFLNSKDVDKVKGMRSKDLAYIQGHYGEFLKYTFGKIIVLSKISDRVYGDQITMCFQEFWYLHKLYILFGDCTDINDAMLKSIFKFIKDNKELVLPGGFETLFSICLGNVNSSFSREFICPYSEYFFKGSECLPDKLKKKIEEFEGESLDFIGERFTKIIHYIEDFLIKNVGGETILISNIENRIAERVDLLLDGTPDIYKTEPNRGRIIGILEKYEYNFVPGGIEALLASFVFEKSDDFNRFEGFFLKNLKYFSKDKFYLMRISERNISKLHCKSFSYIQNMYEGFLVDIFSKISRIECYYKFASTHKDDYKEEDFDFVCILCDLNRLCGDLSLDELKNIFNFMVERKNEVAQYGFDVVFALVIWEFKEREKFNVDVFISRCDEIFPYFYKENFGLLKISECELCMIRSECIFNIFANFKTKEEFCTLFKKIDEGIKSIFFANEENGIEALGSGYFLFFDIIDFFKVNEKCDRLRISEILKYYPCNLEYFKASFTILCIHLEMKILGEEFLKYFGHVLECFVKIFPYLTDAEKCRFISLSCETFEAIDLLHEQFLVGVYNKARRIFDFLNNKELEFDEKLVPMIVEVFDLYEDDETGFYMKVFNSAKENKESMNVNVEIIFFLALKNSCFSDFVEYFYKYVSFFSRDLIYLKLVGENQVDQLRNKTFEELKSVDKNVVNDVISKIRNVEIKISCLKHYDALKSYESLVIEVCKMLNDFSCEHFFVLLTFLCKEVKPASNGTVEIFIGMAIFEGKCKSLKSVFSYCQKITSFFNENKLFLEKFKRIDVSELCGKNLTEILESESILKCVRENLFVFFNEENFFNNVLLSRLCALVAGKYDIDSICLQSFVKLREKCEISIFSGSIEAIFHFIFVFDKCLDFKNFIFLFGAYFNYFRSEEPFLSNDDKNFLSVLEIKTNFEDKYLEKIEKIHYKINMIRAIEDCIGENFRFSVRHTEFLLMLSNKFNKEKMEAISSLMKQQKHSFFEGAIGLLFVYLVENSDDQPFAKFFDFCDKFLDIFKKESSFFEHTRSSIGKIYNSEFVDWMKLYNLVSCFVNKARGHFDEISRDERNRNENIYYKILETKRIAENKLADERKRIEMENKNEANKKCFENILRQSNLNAESSKVSDINKPTTPLKQTENDKASKNPVTSGPTVLAKQIDSDKNTVKNAVASNSIVIAKQDSSTENHLVVLDKQISSTKGNEFSIDGKPTTLLKQTENDRIDKVPTTSNPTILVEEIDSNKGADRSVITIKSVVIDKQDSSAKDHAVVLDKQISSTKGNEFSIVGEPTTPLKQTGNDRIDKVPTTSNPTVLPERNESDNGASENAIAVDPIALAEQIARFKGMCFNEKEIEFLCKCLEDHKGIMLDADEFFFKNNQYKTYFCQVRMFFVLLISVKSDSDHVFYLMKFRAEFIEIFSREIYYFSPELKGVIETADKRAFSEILLTIKDDESLISEMFMFLRRGEISSFNPSITQYLWCNCSERMPVFYDIFIYYEEFMKEYLIYLLKFFELNNQNLWNVVLNSKYEKFLLVFTIVLYEESKKESKEESKFDLLDTFLEKSPKNINEFCSLNSKLIGKMSNLPLRTCVFKYSESLIKLFKRLCNGERLESLFTEEESCQEELIPFGKDDDEDAREIEILLMN